MAQSNALAAVQAAVQSQIDRTRVEGYTTGLHYDLLSLALADLTALAEAEVAYRAAGFKYWPVEKEPAMDRLDGVRKREAK